MGWYPLFVQMRGRRCLIVGGGPVARRTAEDLLTAGATVVVVSQRASAAIDDLAWRHRDRLLIERQPYATRDLSPFALVVAADESHQVNEQVVDDAGQAGVWVNVVDAPDRSTVQGAAVVRRGALQVAVHTGGEYPQLAPILRDELEHYFDPWFETYLSALGRVREWLRKTPPDDAAHPAILRAIADPSLRLQCRGLSEDELFERFVEEANRLLETPSEEP